MEYARNDDCSWAVCTSGYYESTSYDTMAGFSKRPSRCTVPCDRHSKVGSHWGESEASFRYSLNYPCAALSRHTSTLSLSIHLCLGRRRQVFYIALVMKGSNLVKNLCNNNLPGNMHAPLEARIDILVGRRIPSCVSQPCTGQV